MAPTVHFGPRKAAFFGKKFTHVVETPPQTHTHTRLYFNTCVTLKLTPYPKSNLTGTYLALT